MPVHTGAISVVPSNTHGSVYDGQMLPSPTVVVRKVKFFADRVSDSDLGTIGLYRSAPSGQNASCPTGGTTDLSDGDTAPFENPYRADRRLWMRNNIAPEAWLQLGELRTPKGLSALQCLLPEDDDISGAKELMIGADPGECRLFRRSPCAAVCHVKTEPAPAPSALVSSRSRLQHSRVPVVCSSVARSVTESVGLNAGRKS